jgi:hypothetical protein
MELPITKPSMVSYADQIDFNQLVGELSKNKHNGFIRVTHGSEDGYLLFKEGEQIAASYDTYSKLDALEKIRSVTENDRTLVEVFDIKKSQIDFLLDLNKHYIINLKSETDDLLSELQTSRGYEEVEEKKETPSPEVDELPELDELKTEAVEIIEEPEIQFPNTESPDKSSDTNEISVTDTGVSEVEGVPEETSATPDSTADSEPSTSDALNTNSLDTKTIEDDANELEPETEVSETASQSEEVSEPEVPLDRLDLLKKYGIKEVKEEDVENLLDTYKGGSVDEGDVEKIELTLMNKIKKSVLGLPKIRGAEVMVFLDNTNGLSGHVNIIIESESQGFLSKLRGESKDADNLKRQIINISQIEIRKSFRKYPEIVNEFDINVEMN